MQLLQPVRRKKKPRSPPESTMRAQVAPFPRFVPMENKFRDAEYFIRDCYPEYYSYVIELLSEFDGVTVTGTPGIGKSVFMGYFYQEYRKAHPDTVIIMASYNQDKCLTQVVIKRGSEQEQTEKIDEAAMQKALRAASDDASKRGDTASIWLLDGQPDRIPVDVRWVSFSSPNESWKRQLEKNLETVQTVYMPVWTMDELTIAAHALGRDDLLAAVDDAQLQALRFSHEEERNDSAMTVLEARFAAFGGVPRGCFQTRLRNVETQVSSMKNAADSMTIPAIVKAIKSNPSGEPVRRLLHYIPKEDKQAYRIQLASSELERYLVCRARGCDLQCRLAICSSDG